MRSYGYLNIDGVVVAICYIECVAGLAFYTETAACVECAAYLHSGIGEYNRVVSACYYCPVVCEAFVAMLVIAIVVECIRCCECNALSLTNIGINFPFACGLRDIGADCCGEMHRFHILAHWCFAATECRNAVPVRDRNFCCFVCPFGRLVCWNCCHKVVACSIAAAVDAVFLYFIVVDGCPSYVVVVEAVGYNPVYLRSFECIYIYVYCGVVSAAEIV